MNICFMKKLLLAPIMLLALLLVGCEQDAYTGLWQAYDPNGTAVSQLVIDGAGAKMYLYAAAGDMAGDNTYMRESIWLNSLTLNITADSGAAVFLVTEHDLAGLAELSGSLSREGDHLSIKWLHNSGSFTSVPPYVLPMAALPTDFRLVPAEDAAAAQAERPFFASDLGLPFDTQMTPEEFRAAYGEPQTLTTSDHLIGTEMITLTYEGFEVAWLHWLESDTYSFSRFVSGSAKFFPQIRGIMPGESKQSVVGKFPHPQDHLEHLSDECFVLYGVYENIHNFGVIENDCITYAEGDKVLSLDFAADQLVRLEYRVLW